MESDDYILPNMISLLISRATDETGKLYDVIKGSWIAIWPDGWHQRRYLKDFAGGIYEGEWENSPDLMSIPSSIWSAIYRREFLDTHNIRMQETAGTSYQDML